MTARWTPPATVNPLQAAALLALVVLTFAPTMLGRAGFQLIEDHVARSVLAVHQHGVAGEAAYIHEHGTWEGYVSPHCHRDPSASLDHTPAELAVAGLILGPVLCGAAATLPASPDALAICLPEPAVAPFAFESPPLAPPPQV